MEHSSNSSSKLCPSPLMFSPDSDYNPVADTPICILRWSNSLLLRKTFTSVIPTFKMTNVTIPSAPRAMIQQEWSNSSVSSLDQILQSATKNMYPKLVLLEALVSFKDGPKPRERSRDDICEARRDFLDSFAYLCDVEKGGATVTATGLQKLPHTNMLWLAANKGIRGDVETYAKDILQKLKGLESGNQVKIQEDILRLAVQNCRSRIEYYKGKLQEYARRCRMQLRQLRQKLGDDIGAARLFLF
jgi:hypothetical protein